MIKDNDKRKVSTGALETLGTIIGENEKRDAIHLAVIPVVAQENLKPGQHVTEHGKESFFCGSLHKWEKAKRIPIGIVDPFLENDIKIGERFWLFIYPRQIHSLRHVWTHPAFPDDESDDNEIEKSKKWIENYAKEIVISTVDEEEPIDYEILMGLDDDWVSESGYCSSATYKQFDTEYIKKGEFNKYFWTHYEIIRGIKLEEHIKRDFFGRCC